MPAAPTFSPLADAERAVVAARQIECIAKEIRDQLREGADDHGTTDRVRDLLSGAHRWCGSLAHDLSELGINLER